MYNMDKTQSKARIAGCPPCEGPRFCDAEVGRAALAAGSEHGSRADATRRGSFFRSEVDELVINDE